MGCANENWFPLDDNNEVLAGGFWEDLFFSKSLKSLESLSSFFVDCCPQEHCKSISLVLNEAWRLVLALALTVLSTISSQESRSLSRTSRFGLDRRSEAFSKIPGYGILIKRCYGVEFSKNCLQLLQICSPIQNVLLLILEVSFDLGPVTIDKGSKLQQKKVLNFSQVIRIELSALCFRLYCCQLKLIRSCRKDAAKRIWLGPLALAVAKWSSHYWQKLKHFMWDLPQ